jgi:hypothetical protein
VQNGEEALQYFQTLKENQPKALLINFLDLNML